MSYRELIPHATLGRHVDRFWIRTPNDRGCEPAETRVLPDGCVDVLVDLGTGSARVVGAMTRAIVFREASDTRLAAVRFRPGGASAFLRAPIHEFTDRSVATKDAGLDWLPGSINGPDPIAAIATLERALLSRLAAAPRDNRLLARAVERLLEPSPPSIAELARDAGRSRQYINRIFRDRVGTGAKTFARVARLQRAIHHLQTAPNADLAPAAVELGYFDQAHMARDFRLLAGVTAERARLESVSIFPIPSLWLDT